MSNIDKYTSFIAEQIRKGSVAGLRTESVKPITEDKTYSMDYDGEEEDTKGAKALDKAHDHFQKQGYKISHEGSDDPKHKEHKNPDVTYHYAMGDDMHHAFTVHKNGKAANDPHVKKLTKHLEDVTEHTAPDLGTGKLTEAVNTDKYTNYIAEQARKEAIVGLRSKVNEAKDPHEDMENDGWHHFHSTPEGHHIYAHEDTDRGESLHYAVKHPDGKVTHHSIEHAGDPVTSKEMNSKQEWHSVSKHDIPHAGVRKVIHQDIKDETADN